MATFYLLPPRSLFGELLATHYLSPLFPGLALPRSSWGELADLLGGLVGSQGEVYVVYREELPPGEDVSRALADGFGAEQGDEIVEVRVAGRSGEVASRRWRLDGPRGLCA
jgi:hypothetical protein